MQNKPELIVFSQNLLGGGASFHRNMLSHFPKDFFDIKCIYVSPSNWQGAKALDLVLNPRDIIFPYGNEGSRATAKNLETHISNKEGAIVANLETELICLDLYRKKNKTIYFICHDDGFINLAVKYESIIDIFITHNITVYNELIALLPKRKDDIHFIQHGVKVQIFEKQFRDNQKLRIVFLARHHAFKGIYDLPVINDILVKKGVQVEWTILGDGPERTNLMQKVADCDNFKFDIPKTSDEVVDILKMQDVFILPSKADGLPVALLESMSVGCVPVLANFSEGIKKVVTDQIGFVLPVGDNALFAAKIALLSQDRDLLKNLSRHSIEKVKEEFDIEKQALEYFDLYKKYKQLRRNHHLGLKDLQRILSYSSYYNKLIYSFKAVQNKLGLKNSA